MSIRLSMAAMLAVWVVAGSAAAQSLVPSTDYEVPEFYGRGKNTSVLERERPEYQALGVKAGGFTVLPRLDVSATHTDNVYVTKTSKVSDTYFTVNPSVAVQSDWGRHALRGSASVNARRFNDRSSENTTSWAVRGDGRVDVYGDSYLVGGADAQRVYEERGSISGSQSNAKPVPVDIQGFYARGTYGQDRVRASVDGSYRNYDYKNVSGNANQNTRDYDGWQLGGRTDVALSPDTAVFAKATYAENSYKSGVVTQRRDNANTRVLVGANFDLTSVARGELGVGYVKRNYDVATFRDLSGIGVSTKLEYFPSQLLTLTFLGQRQVQDAAFTNSGGYFQNVASVGADYELRRNFVVSGAAGYEYDDFKGISRTDKVVNLALAGRYFVNNTIGLGATVSHADRKSSGLPTEIGPEFKVTKFALSLVFQR